MLAAVRQERPDALVHLGDHANDARALAEEYPLLPLVTVKGNCDFATDAPEQALADNLLKWRQWSYFKLKYQEFEK